MSDAESQPGESLIEPLTRRERDVLRLLAQDQSASEIARDLTLAVSSVKGYIRHLYGKLRVNSRRAAVARAHELGLLEPPAAALPTPVLLPERNHNLPAQVTRFFGRAEEIANLKQRLAEQRLVTLTGTGGVGKTRLSLQAAAEVLDQFAGGVWLVELAAITDPALVPARVAAVLGVREDPRRSIVDNLVLFLRGRQLLLVLDNCEHLLEACAQLAETLLRGAPGLKILASSREPLGIAGEAVFGVRSLPFPDPAHLPPLAELSQYTAFSLFLDRARLVLPDYQPSEADAAAIARLCQRLDGIPLAIEMAAARINVLSAASLAERLDDAFRLLTGGSRTALPRQQTLRAMIDWSYELLSEPERQLFQRLAVFAGGCTLAAAEAVCADAGRLSEQPLPDPLLAGAGSGIPQIGGSEILDLLATLVSKSMVIAERQAGDETRYRLLETMRQYAREKLHPASDREPLRARHLQFFLRLAQTAEPQLRGPAQIAWLDRLETDLDNVRAALDYSQASRAPGAAETGLRLAVTLSAFWNIRGRRREAYAWLEAALARPDIPARSLVRAEALRVAASMSSGAAEAARAEAAESVEIFRQAGPAGRAGLAYALITLSGLVHLLGDFAPKLTMLEESARLFRELDDKWGLALVLHNLAATLDPLVNYQPPGENGAPAPLPQRAPAERNDHTAERAVYEESLALFRGLGDRWALCMDLAAMGHMFFCWGKRAAGQAMYAENMHIVREFGNLGAVAASLRHLGRDALAHVEVERADQLFAESVASRRARYEDESDLEINFMQAEIARRRGQYETAGALLAETLVLRQALGNRDLIAAV
ncbi:MAG: LuxR C-terminal-related transcriptional regulator, partial [Anaerolineales bacterium]